jgi:hypothetical protein
MIWTKKALTEVLEQYADDDVLVGELWTKLDVRHEFAEVSVQAEYENIGQSSVDAFDPDEFWAEYADEFDRGFEYTITENSYELYGAISAKLKGEN